MAPGGVPWAQTFLRLVSFDLQPEVNSRLAQFTDRITFPKLMRVPLRLPPTYRNLVCHLVQKSYWRLSRNASYSGTPSARATITQLPLSGRTVGIPSFLSNGIPSPPSTISGSEPPKGDKSTNPDAKTTLQSKPIEEPLGIPAANGHGYAQFDFGEAIGPHNRYKIVRKLGWGMYSSFWMAFDEHDKKYVAIKALKGHAMALIESGIMQELNVLRNISSDQGNVSKHCTRLLDFFQQPGKGDDGVHLCTIFDLLGGDVRSLILQHKDDDERQKPVPLMLAKRILLHTLRGIGYLHGLGIVHTDLKPSNIMFDHGPLSTEDITTLVTADPPQRNPLERVGDFVFQSAVSQPLPVPSYSEAMTRTYLIADLGSAQWSKHHVFNEITPVALRAPETVLGGPWDEKVDIWVFGCLVFEVLTKAALFTYEPYEPCGLDATSSHLWQMMGFTGENFTPAQLGVSQRSSMYFNEQGRLKPLPPKMLGPFAYLIQKYRALEAKDMQETVALMHRCLRLDPANRPSADELLLDPWWTGVE